MKDLSIYSFGIQIFALSILMGCIPEDNTPVAIPEMKSMVMPPQMGGPTEPNQVWIDLGTAQTKENLRTVYDLAFWNGEDWRVALNFSVMMAAGKITTPKNIDQIRTADVLLMQNDVAVGTFTDNTKYIDHPNGQITLQTGGIAPISPIDELNPVYLINMGYHLYKGNTIPGVVYTTGEPRGWKKIRILRRPQGYLLQYANVDAATHQEILIPKKEDTHFTYYSMTENKTVEVQPQKKKWDIAFTVMTNVTPFPGGGYFTSYIFSDMVITNIHSGVGAYAVMTPPGKAEESFRAFTKDQIQESKFNYQDQRAIGSDWRTTTSPNGAVVYTDRFFILKDAEGHYFKILFTNMKNTQGFRGYPQFEYQPL